MSFLIVLGCLLVLMSGQLDGLANGGKRPNCLKRTVSIELINELLHQTETLINSLPVFPPKIHKRLLPKSLAKKIGIWEINKLLDVYGPVFNHKSLENLYPKHYEGHLARLRHDVQCCLVECSREQKKTTNTMRKLEKTFQKLNINATYKAIGEFKTVLTWIHLARERKENSAEKCQ